MRVDHGVNLFRLHSRGGSINGVPVSTHVYVDDQVISQLLRASTVTMHEPGSKELRLSSEGFIIQ